MREEGKLKNMTMQRKQIKINLSRRLPDLNSHSRLPADYADYGRLAICRDGSIVASGIASSHPRNTLHGFYWALSRDKGTLYLSPRGAAIDWERHLTDQVLGELMNRLGIR